ncbi:mitotic-spindle organizing protein 2-like isoform X1 [Chiroxiphia lanceolata]|uniref:mitotic-spindle organizing protein 2-like isoform X1 n=1 Tax=Chiroxiphia lanceolata TaxID=296741 RepID=UPI0013CEA25D|nr:mitotic-spindle organizing protein 2-like isoform X1 [Chiroxiphia lanceolata]
MAAMAVSEARLRRKQLLSAEEAELFELAQAAGSGLDPEVFRVLLDLLRMNVAPLAVFQVLKSMCAGQRLPPGPEGGPAATAPLPRGHPSRVLTGGIDVSPVPRQLLQGDRMVWEK